MSAQSATVSDMPAPKVASRAPTGRPSYPLVLVEGEEFSGKTYAAAELSASPRIGTTFWLDLGEGTADEYAAIPGAEYQVLEHDGTWAQIVARVDEVRAYARWARNTGEKPTVLVIDTGTDLWEGLKDWVSERARGSDKNRQKLAKDPGATLDVSRNLWNDAGSRYRHLMTRLLTFPGIVVMTARGKVVSATGEDGQPLRDGTKDYRVESHKTLPYDASVWIRMSRTSQPLVVGARSVKLGIRPGRDEPQPIRDEDIKGAPLLEWVIFTALAVDPEHAEVRSIANVTGGELTDDERAEDPEGPPTGQPAVQGGFRRPEQVDWVGLANAAADADAVRDVWRQANAAGAFVGPDGQALGEQLRAIAAAKQEAADPAAPAADDAPAQDALPVDDPPADPSLVCDVRGCPSPHGHDRTGHTAWRRSQEKREDSGPAAEGSTGWPPVREPGTVADGDTL